MEMRTVVVAQGELTGHAHTVAGPEVAFDEASGVLTVPDEAEITHQEHGAKAVPPGQYDVRRAQVRDHAAELTRRVMD